MADKHDSWGIERYIVELGEGSEIILAECGGCRDLMHALDSKYVKNGEERTQGEVWSDGTMWLSFGE